MARKAAQMPNQPNKQTKKGAPKRGQQIQVQPRKMGRRGY
jgi:hypothetical protein